MVESPITYTFPESNVKFEFIGGVNKNLIPKELSGTVHFIEYISD